MSGAPLILAVDRNRRNADLLKQLLTEQGYRTRDATNLDDFDRALDAEEKIDLALVDIAGFDQTIWERCDRLRKMEVPFLVISSRRLAAVAERSAAHGARGVLMKPLVTRDFLGLVHGLLER